MNKDLKDKIATLKKLAQKATRGEWFYSHNPVSGFGAYYACVGPHLRKLPAANTLTDLIHFNTVHMLPVCVIPSAYPIHNGKSDPLIEEQRANGAYITAANPETVLALVSELESLDKEADWLAEAANEIGEHDNSDIAWWREQARKAVEVHNG